MNDSAKLDRAIRFSLVGGMALLAIAAVEVTLIAAGIVPWEARTAILLAFGVVSGSLALLTSVKCDRIGTTRRASSRGTSRRPRSSGQLWSSWASWRSSP
jgi:hypothetical protein